MSWDPVGIETSERFRAYVEALRETWEPTQNQGEPRPDTGAFSA